MQEKVNLLNLDLAGLEAFCLSLGEKPYRAQQLCQWIHRDGVADYELMTNISKSFRATLAEKACIELPQIQTEELSADGTQKWLLKLSCGNCVETVYIPEAKRGTLCISSQIGCALNCSFCSTATQGFARNLTVAEIIGQVWIAVRALSKEQAKHDRAVTNIVLMGMGEPLLNIDNVVPAMSLMMSDYAYNFSKYRVTLSTSGVVPAMYQLKELTNAALAVSLHAPNDELRQQLVPINKKYNLAQLMKVCSGYFEKEPRRKVTFEYVMLKGVNDQLEHARQLVKLLQGVPAKLNLIPFNTYPGTQYECSSHATMRAFKEKLAQGGINTTIRKTRGEDIAAACGQLVGKVKDKTRRSERWQRIQMNRNQHETQSVSTTTEY